MRKVALAILGGTVLMTALYSLPVQANDLYVRPEMFKKHNPDGDKYEFVKLYVQALQYLQMNQGRDQRVLRENLDVDTAEKIDLLLKNLAKENVTLRVASNYLEGMKRSDNKLILKSIQLFENYVAGQIALNAQEENALKSLQVGLSDSKSLRPEEFAPYRDKQLRIAESRKEVSKRLLESSLLVTKVLVSNEVDRFGELVNLGVTDRQRQELLRRLENFYGHQFEGNMREGQSFLQASVVVIKDRLTDTSWGTIDETRK